MTDTTDIPDESALAQFQADHREGFASEDEVQAFSDSLNEAFDIGVQFGYKIGYRKAVEESYPELDDEDY